MNSKIGIAVTAVAVVIAVVCLVLVFSYRSTQSAVTHQLQQVEQAQEQASKTSQQANSARLGICWSSTEDSSTFDVQSVQIESPIVSGGVYQCPTGTNFVSVVPVSGG